MNLHGLYNVANYKGLKGMLFNDDCFKLMKKIDDKSIDCIICDLPYGVTRNHWDSELPLDILWENYNRIIKDNGAICLFADGMFLANLMKSNTKMWRYNLIWDKILPSGFLNANRMPLRRTEEIVIFYKKQPTYNPQKTKGKPNHTKGIALGKSSKDESQTNNNYGEYEIVDNSKSNGNMKHPTSLISISKPHPSIMKHPTEKPIKLIEWLIKTYTNENEIILDNCMGSGTTCHACINTNRRYIGCELDENYFNVAKERIINAENFTKGE
jgi:site-specific DNA-methyltransferase (adenine-specific)